MPSSLRKALNELPTSLDDTYERALEGIPKEQRQHAHRLFQCLVAAIRPLRAEELAEIFAIEFDLGAVPSLSQGWRPENPEEAVLSTCSTLITIIEDKGSKIIQFSHFSVKEFLTSGRLLTSEIGGIREYHISLDAAHTILAQACLTVLLQLDENVDKKRLATFPLALYAARYWVNHAKFEDVASRVQDAIECLFNPQKPFLAAWAWMYDADWGWFVSSIDALPEYPSPLEATALYYAAFIGFSALANHLIVMHGEDVNSKCGNQGSPLHAASYRGHTEVVCLLLDHGADINSGVKDDRTPLVAAYLGEHFEVMRVLLEHGAVADMRYNHFGLILHGASYEGRTEVVELLLRYKADVNARSPNNWTPMHWASTYGHVGVVQLLLECGADVNARQSSNWTPLHCASVYGDAKLVQLLLECGADVNAQTEGQNTPLHLASGDGHVMIVQVLLRHGANVHLRHGGNLTPLQVATSTGRKEIARLLSEHGGEKE
jgi:ankyrin repeat protein